MGAVTDKSMASQLAVEEPGALVQDQHQWDTRLRHLAALCRYGQTAPVSFYGLRRVCGLCPMEREDYDIVRVEVRQLVDSMDSVVRRLEETDHRMLASKRNEQNQVRTLASTYTAVRDELDYKESTLAVVTQTNADLATALDDEVTEKLKAVAARDDARAVVNSNQRIYHALESEAINYQASHAERSNLVIENQIKELIEFQRKIARLRNQMDDQSAAADDRIAKLSAEVTAADAEKQILADTLTDARSMAVAAADAASASLSELQSRYDALSEQCASTAAKMKVATDNICTEQEAAAQEKTAAQERFEAQAAEYEAKLSQSQSALAAEQESSAQLRAELRSTQFDFENIMGDKEYLTKQLLESAEKLSAMERIQLQEKRSLTGDKLRLSSEKKELQAVVDESVAATEQAVQEKEDAVAAMQAQLDDLTQQVMQANAVALQAKKDMDKEVTKRTNAYVSAKAEAALRIATEESKVFDRVPKYIADKAQEEKDLHRFLDAATYRLSEVNYVQKEILGSEFVEQTAIEGSAE